MLKTTKKASRVLALALAFIMCLSTVVWANPPTVLEDGALQAANQDNPVQVAITKLFRMPIGTTTPDAVFKFKIVPDSVNGDDSEDAIRTMPVFGDEGIIKIEFDASDTRPHNPENNIITIDKETGDILKDITFPHAGHFVYKVTEIKETNDLIDDDEPYQTLSYSTAEYELNIYVANKMPIDGTTYVYGIGAIVKDGEDEGWEVGTKVDPTPGGGPGFTYSHMTFTNDYVKTNAPEEPDKPNPVDESTLVISKTVSGDLGDTTRPFNFNLNLTIPILVEEIPPYYKAYVVGIVGDNEVVIQLPGLLDNVVDSSLAIANPDGYDYINVSSTGPTGFRLKHGQRLVFVDTPVGTSYTVTEDYYAGYVQTVVVTTNGTAGETINQEPERPLETGTQFVGEAANIAAFTNNRASVVPTGLNINNLPFVGLIALSVLALIGFIAVKSRKRSYAAYR
ncbi:MAG: hypothetical protein FWC32_12105 [Firmicutes bacterium]|nr:hypothetical protein [Bacillota bacterium]